MKIRTKVSVLVIALFSVLAVAPGALAAPVVAASTTFPGHVGGRAYAGYVNVPAGLAQVSVGPLFPVARSCGVTASTLTASSATLHLAPAGSAGSTTDTLTSTRSTTGASVQAVSNIASVNLLSGLISADAIHSVATTTAKSGSATSTGGATFTNLVVAGKHIAASPAKNTTITLPGLGKVILNEISGPVNGSSASHITVTAIDIQVSLSNSLGLPVGAKVTIGYANSNYVSTNTPSVLSASAYALEATGLSGDVTSGPWASASVGCEGGNNTNSLTSESVSGVLKVGTLTDSASGVIGSSATTATSSSTAQAINLLNGLITATAVTSTAAVNSGAHSATGSTTLTNLKVLGIPVSASPTPNLTISLPGIGKVVINEQSLHPGSSTSSSTVTAIDVYITVSNVLGIPTGAQILVGHVKASYTLY